MDLLAVVFPEASNASTLAFPETFYSNCALCFSRRTLFVKCTLEFVLGWFEETHAAAEVQFG